MLGITLLALAACGGGGGGGQEGPPITFALSAEAQTPSQAHISWTADPDALSGYDLYRNGVAVSSIHIRGTSITDNGLEPATRYCYHAYGVAFPLGVVGASNESCVVTPGTAGWSITTAWVDDPKNIALALDHAGKAHISYKSRSGLAYLTNAGGSWTRTLVDDTVGEFGSSSIAVDQTGAVHIAYQDDVKGGLKHATNASSQWVVSLVSASGVYASLAVDASGKVHLSYAAGDASNALIYTTDASGIWQSTFVSPGAIMQTSIAVDGAGRAHIGYAHGDGVTCDIGHATNASGSWVDSTVAYPVKCAVSLALDGANNVHLGYMVAQPGFALMYASNASGIWTTTLVDRFDWVPGNNPAIAVDASGHGHLTYTDQNADLKYATNAGGSWAPVYVDAKGEAGIYNAIAVAPDGRAHVAYSFRDPATNVGALRYTTSP